MSIYDEIAYWSNQNRLFLLRPSLGEPATRTMYVCTEVQKLLDGPWDNPEWETRCFHLAADLENFVRGRRLAVSTGTEGITSQLKRLDPARDEVWEIRSRAPQPGLRVLGRFAQKDVFVAISWYFRVDLGEYGAREWRDACVGCIAEWNKLFPHYEPLLGDDLRDYVSNIEVLD